MLNHYVWQEIVAEHSRQDYPPLDVSEAIQVDNVIDLITQCHQACRALSNSNV